MTTSGVVGQSAAGQSAAGQSAGMPTNDVRILLGIVTEDEFARAVGVVGPTVAIWRNRGEGPPFYRFKRNIFYRTADIVQWIIEHTWDPKSGVLLLPAAYSTSASGLPGDRQRTVPPHPPPLKTGVPELDNKLVKSNPQRGVPDDEPGDPAPSAA